MLSNDLRSLRDYFDATVLGTGQMTSHVAEAFSSALTATIEQAEALEGRPVDPFSASERATEELIRASRLMSGAANVVLLSAARGEFGGLRSCLPCRPDDGGAA
jgi:hypothetical protein